jgi:hypothetical protein
VNVSVVHPKAYAEWDIKQSGNDWQPRVPTTAFNAPLYKQITLSQLDKYDEQLSEYFVKLGVDYVEAQLELDSELRVNGKTNWVNYKPHLERIVSSKSLSANMKVSKLPPTEASK